MFLDNTIVDPLSVQLLSDIVSVTGGEQEEVHPLLFQLPEIDH